MSKKADIKKISNLEELAALCGVSVSTASRVLSNEPGISADTRAAVLKIAAEHDFEVRRRRRPVSRAVISVLVVVPDGNETSLNPFYDIGEMYNALNSAFQGEKMRSEVITFSELEHAVSEGLEADALLLAFGEPELSCRDCLEQTGIPYVYLNRMQPGAGYVSCNNFRGMETLAGHVLARGRMRPGYLGWKSKPVNADRLKGFMAAAWSAGLDINTLPLFMADGLDGVGKAAARFFIDAGCDAVCCFNDVFAIRLIQALNTQGRSVPAEVSVTGFDNNPVRQHFSPLVTTISLSVYEMTFFAARWLRDRIISRDAGMLRLEIDGQLIEGESV